MRRAIAHSLVTIFIWVLIAPLLSPAAEANLPSCCRRNGKHHCMMYEKQRPVGTETGIASISAKCPCVPDSTGAVHSAKFTLRASAVFYAEAVANPAYAPQTAARFRVSFLRSHQRRGPPSPLA